MYLGLTAKSFAYVLIVFVIGTIFGSYMSAMIAVQDRMFRWTTQFRKMTVPGDEVHSEVPSDFIGDHESFDKRIRSTPIPVQTWDDYRENHSTDDRTVADVLFKYVRVFCWVLTMPKNKKSKAEHVKATWLKRCNRYVFISSEDDPSLPAIKLPDVKEGRAYLWNKTKAAFRHIYDNHLNDYDWFLKADDDTYVIMENLRHMLSYYNNSQPVHFGRQFHLRGTFKQAYMSGGGGYVLSREAVKRFVENGIGGSKQCKSLRGRSEDVAMGQCLELVGVTDVDSRDEHKLERFHPFTPNLHLNKNTMSKDNWFWRWIIHPTVTGPGCCSDYTISFHYVTPNLMYVMEFFIYHLRPFGISARYSVPPNLQDSYRKMILESKSPAKKNSTSP